MHTPAGMAHQTPSRCGTENGQKGTHTVLTCMVLPSMHSQKEKLK